MIQSLRSPRSSSSLTTSDIRFPNECITGEIGGRIGLPQQEENKFSGCRFSTAVGSTLHWKFAWACTRHYNGARKSISQFAIWRQYEHQKGSVHAGILSVDCGALLCGRRQYDGHMEVE